MIRRLTTFARRLFVRAPRRDHAGRFTTRKERRAIIRTAQQMRDAMPGHSWRHAL